MSYEFTAEIDLDSRPRRSRWATIHLRSATINEVQAVSFLIAS